MIQKKIAIALLACSTAFISCNDDEGGEEISTSQITLDIDGLNDLGDDYKYEGWIIVDGSPVTTGVFSVDGEGVMSQTKFDVDKNDLASATKFVLSIEPTNDEDPAPSTTKYLVGDFSGSSANLSTDVIADFSNIWGKYILATPSDDDTTNDYNGIWWLTQPGPEAGLYLPELVEGWVYEGWVVTMDGPISTGTFTSVTGADSDGAGATAGPNGTPPFPGQDFISPAIDLRGKTAVISIEPYPDNSAAPFTLKPLVGTIGTDTAPTSQTMDNNITGSFPTGSVWR